MAPTLDVYDDDDDDDDDNNCFKDLVRFSLSITVLNSFFLPVWIS
jgi:hypothetical protein